MTNFKKNDRVTFAKGGGDGIAWRVYVGHVWGYFEGEVLVGTKDGLFLVHEDDLNLFGEKDYYIKIAKNDNGYHCEVVPRDND